jgi:hypothetical protein
VSKISKEQYDAMLESHRGAPGNVSAAARAARCSRATASKYWQHGGDEAWMLPLRRVIEREQTAARAALEAERVERARERGEELGTLEAEQARADLGRELAETAKLSRKAKQNAFDLLCIVESLLVGCRKIEGELRDAFESGAISKLVQSKPAEAIRLVRELARLVQDGNQAGETAAKLERILLGDGGPGGDVTVVVETPDDALAIIERANRAARRARGDRSTTPPAVH